VGWGMGGNFFSGRIYESGGRAVII